MGYNPTGLTGTLYSSIFERIPVVKDTALDIYTCGLDNLYYQRGEQLRLSSPLCKSSTEVLEDFLNGSGFSENGDIVVNRFGETYGDILNKVAKDASRYSGAYALHLNFDGTGTPIELQHIPFLYVRMSISKRTDGRITHVLVSDNWERSDNKRKLKPVKYRMLNPLEAQNDVINSSRGQVLYFTGVENGLYPLLTIDSIINTALTDRNIQLYEKNNVARGFHGASIMSYRSSIESEQERKKIKEKAEALVGTNSPGILVMTKDTEDTAPTIETIPANDTSDLFTVTLGAVQDRVLQVMKQPPALLGFAPDGGVFTQLAYQESFIVYNVITRNGRKSLSKGMNRVSNLMGENLGPIIENKFHVEGQELITPTI